VDRSQARDEDLDGVMGPAARRGQPLGRQESEPGWLLGGRYRMLDRLGVGGAGEVFRAHDLVLKRDVAVKMFRTLLAEDLDARWAQRCKLELQSLAQLNHPNLVTLFDGSVDPPYLVLELVPGPDLAARLRDGPLPEPEVRTVAVQLADALAYAHEHGMVHRDVKPANILLGEDGSGVQARLSDFGTVRLVDSARITAPDVTLGTASYIAPEQARNAAVGPAADLYSLGLVLLEALTGVQPFSGLPHEVLAARLRTSPSIPQELPAPWPDLLVAMTASDPARRPSAAAVANRLRTGTGSSSPPIAVGTALADDARVRIADDRHRGTGTWIALAALACAAVLSGAAFLLISGTGGSRGDTGPTLPTRLGSHVLSTSDHHRTSHPAAQRAPNDPHPSAARRPSRTHATLGRQHPTHPSRNQPVPARAAASSSAPITTPAPPSPTASPTASSTASPTASSTTSSAAPSTSTTAPTPPPTPTPTP
jgi:serine/threonine protein kinase